jgi:hypothetical protein
MANFNFKFASFGAGLNLHPERLKALREGRATFWPGFDCIHGHHAERRVNGRMECLECNRLKNHPKLKGERIILKGRAWYEARGLTYVDTPTKT